MSVANNNYTINSVQYTVTENSIIVDELGQNYMELTIVPDSGYTVTASDFSLVNPANPTYVSSVVFSQSGLNVLVTINLVTTAIMPGGNLDLGLCIAGVAYPAKVDISGIYNTEVQSNISPSSQTNVPYSDSGDAGDLVTLFSKTFTADAGFYIISSGVVVTQGNTANYSFEETPQFNAEGYLVSITYVVKYLFPAQSYSGDVIDFTLRSKLLPIVQPVVVTSYSELPAFVSAVGENIAFSVFGENGAVYSVSMTDGTSTVNIAQNAIIPSSGQNTHIIEFPVWSGSGYVEWEISLTGDLANPFLQPLPIIVRQYADVELTVTGESTNPNISYTSAQTFSVPALQNYTPPIYTANIEATIDIDPSENISVTPFALGKFKEEIAVNGAFTGPVTNASTLNFTLLEENYGNLQVGDRFNFSTNDPLNNNNNEAPFGYTVTSINGSLPNLSVGITPPLTTTAAGGGVSFFRTNGNVSNGPTAISMQQISDTSITLHYNFILNRSGDADATFTFDLDDVVTVVPALFGPFIFNYDSNFSASGACCGPTSTSVYLNTNSLATATEMYLPVPGYPPATLSGSYSDGSIYRNYDGQTGLFLTPAINCSGCSQSLFLCYAAKSADDLCCGNATTVQVWVAQGETFLNNSGLYQDASLTTAAPNGFYSDNACFNQPIP